MLSQKTIFRVSRLAQIPVSTFQLTHLNLVKKLTHDFGFFILYAIWIRVRQNPMGMALSKSSLSSPQFHPEIRPSVYFTGAFKSKTLHSERPDFKDRAYSEDLESRRDWQTSDSAKFTGEVYFLSPLEIRGRQTEVSIHCSRNPCFSSVRWKYRDSHMAVVVRPSPPYRDWVLGESSPLNWTHAVSRLDRMLDSLAPNRGPRTADASCSADIPIVPLRPKSQDFWCQFMSSCRSVSRQAVPSTRDCGVGPDLIHLETTLSIFRPYWFYHPPWQVAVFHVVDSNGVIRGIREVTPTSLKTRWP